MIRHGQSVDNVTGTISGPDTLLSDLGREQAKSIGKKLLELGTKFDAVYSSTFARASETARIICKELGISNIVFDKRLREGDGGIYTGRRFDDLTKEEKEFFEYCLTNPDERVPGGETNNEQMIRTKEVFLEIVENHPENSILLIIGHGGTLYHILKRTLDILPERDEWFGNCMLNILERNSLNDEWFLSMLDNIKLDV
ncbi:MAG: histidine phosphatase family protein [Candidatus Thorarchaeota archaeon]